MITPELVRNAIDAIKRRSDYEYFFDNLSSPEWIEPLRRHGFFQNPEKAIREGNTIRFPAWPESRYLARMASKAPDTVLSVILKLPETENIRVHEDCIRAVMAMPADRAALWVKREVKWIDKQDHLYMSLPHHVGPLISYLAKGGQSDAALSLASALLDIRADARPAEESKVNPLLGGRPEPRSLFDPWEYGEILKENVPDLMVAAPRPAFDLLCQLLEKYCVFSTEQERRDGRVDLSFVWRPAIEEHEQNSKYKAVLDALVEAARNAAERLVRDRIAELPAVVEGLEKREWTIFKRIALHLLRVFHDKAPELVAERLTNRKYFDAGELRHEYALLSRDCFGQLAPEQQQVILEWIDATTVDLDEIREHIRRFMGMEPGPLDAERIAKHGKLGRLKPMRDSLPAEWLVKYNQWVTDVGGEPEHPEFVSYHTSGTGPTSPKSAIDLKAMTVDELVAYFKAWKPSGDRMLPTAEGLGGVLTAAVAEAPVKYATAAERFQEVDPTYVCSFLFGLRQVVSHKKQTFPWEPVLRLCQWVVEQPREIPGRRSEYAADTGWGWARKSIADLVGVAFEAGVAQFDLVLRDSIWRIIERLSNDPDPTPEHEAKYGGKNMDLSTLSINTTRGEALHAVLRYALWVKERLERERTEVGQKWRGLDEVPEVRSVLEEHLDPLRDPSLAIRSVYGQRYAWLEWLDVNWMRANANRIFPIEESSRSLHDAAWEAYLFFCWPGKESFEILQSNYRLAVERLTESKGERVRYADPDERLGCHLVYLCGQGVTDVDNGVLRSFFARAPDVVRAESITFIGRSLMQEEWQGSEAVLSRLEALGEWRMSEIGKETAAEQNREELEAFGWWFGSDKFEDRWAVEMLLKVLKLTKRVDADFFVAKRLVGIVRSMPEEAVECLRLMIEGAREEWEPYKWRDEMRKILDSAIQGKNLNARVRAIELVDRLGAMGYRDYRDLRPIDESTPSR